jgi:2-hydroxychromene-2-carboxylate isomerase
MTLTVDYYFAPQSPWTYLGHASFAAMAQQANATVRLWPVDLGRVFPVSGGLPLGKRAPQRQAYRLVELQRYSDYLQVPLNLHPLHFPVSGDAASRLIIATDTHCGSVPAMKLAGAVLAAVWAQERNIADEAVLVQLLQECGLAADLLDNAHSQAVQDRYEVCTQAAIEAGVFGSPSYVIDGEIFWGQDRLEFVQRKLLHAECRLQG